MKTNKLKKVIAVLTSSAPLALLAQEAAAPVSVPQTGHNDMIWYIIISIAAVLLFVILILGNVLVSLAKLIVEKNKTAVLILMLLVSGSLSAQGTNPSVSSGGSGLAANWNLIMASCLLIAELVTIIILLNRISAMIGTLSPKKEKKPGIQFQMPKIFDKINASVPMEKEQDILLDHNYDGIRELNNNLPPWWKYSFYLSIIFAICYMTYYHVLGGPSSHDEYNTAVKKAQEQQAEYARLHANSVDENSVTMADASGIDDGKTIFSSNCAVCHGHAGEGVVGPNLTDKYWLHGGSIHDVFKSVKYGWPAKGMKSWQTDLSPVQMKNVVSYIFTLQGTNPPNPKAPQGDLYSPADGKPVQTAADTSTAKSI